MSRVWLRSSLIAAGVVGAAAGGIESVGRALAEKAAPAVIPITAVLRIESPQAPAGGQERPIEIYGTLVSEDGMILVSATSLSPLNNIGDVLAGSGMTTRVSRIRARLANGLEVALRQLITDEEMDLTCLVPEAGAEVSAPVVWPAPVTFERGVRAELCDSVLTVGRSGEIFRWAPVVGIQQIICRVDEPRTYYVTAGPYSGGVGTPIFRADGQALGMTVIRREPAAIHPGRSMPFNQVLVVLPSDAVAEFIEQARKALQAKTEAENH